MTTVNHDTPMPPERLFETDAGGWVRAHPRAEAYAKDLGAMITRVVGPGAEAVLIPYRMGPHAHFLGMDWSSGAGTYSVTFTLGVSTVLPMPHEAGVDVGLADALDALHLCRLLQETVSGTCTLHVNSGAETPSWWPGDAVSPRA